MLHKSEHFKSANEEYKNIIKICSTQPNIPEMSLDKAREILIKIRPSVNDFYSITGLHYRYAGDAGVVHFQQSINGIIKDLNNSSISELNTVLASILHKGHGKDKTLDTSYRTISICPFISKGTDTYISELYGHCWQDNQADTQYQGKGRSHELAALLLTETIQHSLNTLTKPIHVLYLDAKSAFDLVLCQILLLIDHETYCEWNDKTMGLIVDMWGLGTGWTELMGILQSLQ